VVLPGLSRESAGNHDPASIAFDEGAIQLRKTQVITDRHAYDAEGRLRRHDLFARLEMRRFAIAVFAIWAQRDIEEMDLPIPGSLEAFRRDHHAGVVDPRIAVDRLGDRPAE